MPAHVTKANEEMCQIIYHVSMCMIPLVICWIRLNESIKKAIDNAQGNTVKKSVKFWIVSLPEAWKAIGTRTMPVILINSPTIDVIMSMILRASGSF